MFEGKATLVIDLGNSETRVITLFGKNKSGIRGRKKAFISNRFSPYDPLIPLNDEINGDNSVIFRARGEVGDLSVDQEYAGGLLVDREYRGREPLRPTALEKKYNSLTTLLSLNRAFLEGYRAVSSMSGHPIEDLDLTWKVAVLLPPQDQLVGAKEMAKIIRSIEQIDFTLPKVTKKIVIEEGGIQVFPEGFCAFMGTMFLPGRKMREDYASFRDDTVLVVDIGAGTTDMIVIDGAKPVEASKFTVGTGGNNITQSVRRRLRARGIELDSETVARGVTRGSVRVGASVESISDEIVEAKREIAQKLVSSLVEFFEQNSFPPQRINKLLVVGGGASESRVEGDQPIGNFLVERMKSFSPKVGLVELPKEKQVNDEDEVSYVSINPRILNITGAAIMAE